jgi:DNA-binding NarL/FixJ family response regulator
MGKLLSRALVVHPQALIRAGVVGILAQELGIVEIAQLDSACDLRQHLQLHRDWMMLVVDPNIDGFGGIEGIANYRRSFPWLRIAVLSEISDRQLILAALAAGAHGFVTSDSSLEEMAVTFRAVMEGHIHVPDVTADLDEDRAPARSVPSASDLTARQRDVARHMARGLSNKEIGRALRISESTVKVHISAVFKALCVCNRVQAAAAIDEAALLRRTADEGLLPRVLDATQGKLFH